MMMSSPGLGWVSRFFWYFAARPFYIALPVAAQGAGGGGRATPPLLSLVAPFPEVVYVMWK